MKISELLAKTSLHDSAIVGIKSSEAEFELLIDLCSQDVGAGSDPILGSLRFTGVREVKFDGDVELSDDAEILSTRVHEVNDSDSLEILELLIQDGSNVVTMSISAEEVSWNPTA